MIRRASIALLLLVATMPVAVSSEAVDEPRVDATAAYDPNNVFARILRGELPANVVYENDVAIAFHDINPQARVHVLVVPKGAFANLVDFAENASAEEKLGLIDAIEETTKRMDVHESGFKLITNTGEDGGQTVPHLHFHILGGERL